LVRRNAAGVDMPGALASRVNEPTIAFAVKVEAVAVPVPSVMTLSINNLPANVPLAPVPGAVNVTRTPDNRFPEESRTMAFRGVV